MDTWTEGFVTDCRAIPDPHHALTRGVKMGWRPARMTSRQAGTRKQDGHVSCVGARRNPRRHLANIC